MGGHRRSSARVRSPVPEADEDFAVAHEADQDPAVEEDGTVAPEAEADPAAPGYDKPSLESRV
ncbi:hypothetical protein PMG11_09257 [Penicillium brasilianum]|uniref:Uncharacterized protein n=1 Tax=Penicillium brasilianum TaxID=104259 RepID=A0A0F7TVE9_PENBI|nr:hypothetical protein PMG11_09257 [Penicillium brasilianum]